MADAWSFNIEPSRLRLGAVLARGTPGVVVYQADLQVGKHIAKVAVKKLHTSAAPAAAEAAFLAEVQTLQLASATCTRVCRMLGCCKLDDNACIVMSLYPKSAATRLEETQGALQLQEVVAMSLDILEGLAQLHAMQILHLDLKPGNVLLDDYGHAYISDFGISRALCTLEACSAVSTSIGTPHYMAPEQVDAEFGLRGKHTDVWGFATCILHLVTGQLPYEGKTFPQMVSAMLRKRSPEVPAVMPGWLQQVLQQCLNFDTTARPSVADLHQVFEGHLNTGHGIPGRSSRRDMPLPSSSSVVQAQQVLQVQLHQQNSIDGVGAALLRVGAALPHIGAALLHVGLALLRESGSGELDLCWAYSILFVLGVGALAVWQPWRSISPLNIVCSMTNALTETLHKGYEGVKQSMIQASSEAWSIILNCFGIGYQWMTWVMSLLFAAIWCVVGLLAFAAAVLLLIYFCMCLVILFYNKITNVQKQKVYARQCKAYAQAREQEAIELAKAQERRARRWWFRGCSHVCSGYDSGSKW